MAKTIIAIGGGDLYNNETLSIDEYVVKCANKSIPKLLFIPTASGEPQGYIDAIQHIYGEKLGCMVDVLKILTEQPTKDEVREKILSADIIYVGGGNTAKMMETWKKWNIDEYLRQAYNNGIVLSGMSAGSICWFESGHSDSFLKETGEYCIVNGLGIIPNLHCPHYNQRPEFDEFMKKVKNTIALAIEDKCAIVFQDGYYKIIKSDDSAKVFLFVNKNGVVKKRVIDNVEFVSVNELEIYS